MSYIIKTEPAKEPLSLFEVKDHLRLDHDSHDEDDLLQGIIKAARRHAEIVMANRAFITQTWELWLDAFPSADFIELPMPPLQVPAVTAGAFVTGTVYRILTVGNTDFTLIGASANTVGTVFTATGAGTGTGTATASCIINYYDTEDTEYSFAGSYYLVDTKSQPGRICLNHGQSWPSTTLRPRNGVCVTFVAGYGDSGDDIPSDFRAGLLLIIGHFYEHREEVMAGLPVTSVPMGAKSLISSQKVY